MTKELFVQEVKLSSILEVAGKLIQKPKSKLSNGDLSVFKWFANLLINPTSLFSRGKFQAMVVDKTEPGDNETTHVILLASSISFDQMSSLIPYGEGRPKAELISKDFRTPPGLYACCISYGENGVGVDYTLDWVRDRLEINKIGTMLMYNPLLSITKKQKHAILVFLNKARWHYNIATKKDELCYYPSLYLSALLVDTLYESDPAIFCENAKNRMDVSVESEDLQEVGVGYYRFSLGIDFEKEKSPGFRKVLTMVETDYRLTAKKWKLPEPSTDSSKQDTEFSLQPGETYLNSRH